MEIDIGGCWLIMFAHKCVKKEWAVIGFNKMKRHATLLTKQCSFRNENSLDVWWQKMNALMAIRLSRFDLYGLSTVYTNKSQTIDQLKGNIRAEISTILAAMLEKVMENAAKRAHFALLNKGDHLIDVLFTNTHAPKGDTPCIYVFGHHYSDAYVTIGPTIAS